MTTEPEFYPDLDDLERLADEWDPDAGDGLPGEAINDPEWLRKRLLSLAFARAEVARLEAELAAERARVEDRGQALLDPIASKAARVEQQLKQFHRARIADEQRRGVKKPTTMVKLVWGALRSGAGRARVVVDDQDAAVAFMRRHKMHDALHEPVAEWRVNLSKAPAFVGEVDCPVCGGTGEGKDMGRPAKCAHTDEGHAVGCNGGKVLRVLAPSGKPVPGLSVVPGERWFKVDTEPVR